jgi:hypothetical protein
VNRLLADIEAAVGAPLEDVSTMDLLYQQATEGERPFQFSSNEERRYFALRAQQVLAGSETERDRWEPILADLGTGGLRKTNLDRLREIRSSIARSSPPDDLVDTLRLVVAELDQIRAWPGAAKEIYETLDRAVNELERWQQALPPELKKLRFGAEPAALRNAALREETLPQATPETREALSRTDIGYTLDGTVVSLKELERDVIQAALAEDLRALNKPSYHGRSKSLAQLLQKLAPLEDLAQRREVTRNVAKAVNRKLPAGFPVEPNEVDRIYALGAERLGKARELGAELETSLKYGNERRLEQILRQFHSRSAPFDAPEARTWFVGFAEKRLLAAGRLDPRWEILIELTRTITPDTGEQRRDPGAVGIVYALDIAAAGPGHPQAKDLGDYVQHALYAWRDSGDLPVTRAHLERAFGALASDLGGWDERIQALSGRVRPLELDALKQTLGQARRVVREFEAGRAEDKKWRDGAQALGSGGVGWDALPCSQRLALAWFCREEKTTEILRELERLSPEEARTTGRAVRAALRTLGVVLDGPQDYLLEDRVQQRNLSKRIDELNRAARTLRDGRPFDTNAFLKLLYEEKAHLSGTESEEGRRRIEGALNEIEGALEAYHQLEDRLSLGDEPAAILAAVRGESSDWERPLVDIDPAPGQQQQSTLWAQAFVRAVFYGNERMVQESLNRFDTMAPAVRVEICKRAHDALGGLAALASNPAVDFELAERAGTGAKDLLKKVTELKGRFATVETDELEAALLSALTVVQRAHESPETLRQVALAIGDLLKREEAAGLRHGARVQDRFTQVLSELDQLRAPEIRG